MVERDYENAYKAHISRWGVGATLRGAREAGGETIAEAASASRIRAEYIHALENEDFQVLPGWAHALSYVRTYADYLGLEPLPLVKRVREQIELRQHLTQPSAAVGRGLGRWQTAAGIAVILGAAATAGWYATGYAAGLSAMIEQVPRGLKAMIDRRFVTVADDEQAVSQSGVSMVSSGQESAGREEVLALGVDIEPPAEAAMPQAAGGTVPIASSAAARFAPLRDAVGSGDKVVLATHPRDTQDRVDPPISDVILRARGSVWLTVEDADGRSLLAQQIDEGALYRLPTGSGFTVTTDNAGAFEVYVEGALAGLMGAAGSSVTRLPVDSLTERRADG